MTVINIKYSNKKVVDDAYWKSIGVNIELLRESKLLDVAYSFEQELSKMNKEALLELQKFFNIGTYDEALTNNEIVDCLKQIEPNNMELILKIREFTLRKKRAINNFYQEIDQVMRIYSTSIVQSLQLYNISPSYLCEIETYNSWLYRASDKLYTSEKNISFEKVMEIIKNKGFRDKICNDLYKASGSSKNYDLFSFANIGNKKVIILFYKQINDKIVADFKEVGIRNREVGYLLVQFDILNNTVEIRDYINSEKDTILKYIQETLNTKLNELRMEVFYDYKVDRVKSAFLDGVPINGEINENFQVTKMFFKRSTLKNSPKITFEVDYDDIWPSIQEAHQNKTINLQSLKDIGSLTIKALNMHRTIRTIVLDSGDVIFNLNDSNLDEINKIFIEKMFLDRFGIPLNQPVSDTLFETGYMDKVDYIMSLTRLDKFDEVTQSLIDKLLEEQLIELIEINISYCKECKKEYDYQDKICSTCEIELKNKKDKRLKINIDTVTNFIEDKIRAIIEALNDWVMESKKSYTIEGKKFEFYSLYNDTEDYLLRILIAFEPINPRVLKRIQNMLVPTIIVYIGENKSKIETISDGCITAINFGYLYAIDLDSQVKYFVKTVEDFIIKSKHYISKAAFVALKNLEDAQKDFNKMDSKQFEDDVYAIIKDLSLNSKKWGTEYSGKPVPEGVFTISYSLNKGGKSEKEQHVFTYDCKYSKSRNGYNLNIDEHRKAAEYVLNVSNSDFVSNFSTNNAVTTHIIISNNVNEVKVQTMQDYFAKQVNQMLPTKVILLPLKSLIKLYELYLTHFEALNRSLNQFKKMLIELLTSDGVYISEQDVINSFKRVTNPGLEEFKNLDVKEVTIDLVGHKK